jgi:hypothetical protein
MAVSTSGSTGWLIVTVGNSVHGEAVQAGVKFKQQGFEADRVATFEISHPAIHLLSVAGAFGRSKIFTTEKARREFPR